MAGKILFIVVDQFRADCLNGALSGDLDLPNLRGLMKEGITFNRHYTVTTPCGPARASLLTGLYAMNHRSVRNGAPLNKHHPTIGTEMRKAGYDPMLFGYTDVSPDPEGRDPNDPELRDHEGLAAGFSEIVRMRFETNSSWLGDLNAKGYKLPNAYWFLYQSLSPDPSKRPKITDPTLYSADDSDTAFLANQTLRELSVREKIDWFSLVTFLRPHPPLVAPRPYNQMYSPDAVSMPSTTVSIDELKSAHPFHHAYYAEPANYVLYIGFDGRVDNLLDRQIAELRAVYYGLATEVDHHIGRLLDYLRQSGQYDDTLIVFTSDHGEMLGDHHQWGKNSMFEQSLQIPLIIRDPKRRGTAGTQVEAFTESIDIAPTLLDWVGQPASLGFNGKSLLPFLEGETPENWRTHIFAEVDLANPVSPTRFERAFKVPANQCNYAVLRDEQFKYVHFNGGLPPMLFDMKNDPGETTNLANVEAHQKTLAEMSAKMLDHRMTHAHHALSRMQITPDGVKTG